MPNFFYFDQFNQKQGPVDDQQLKDLVAQGVIGPQTPLETDTGHKGTAGQIPGLFGATSVPFAQPGPAAPKQMFCTNCGKAVDEHAVACMSCGAKPVGHRKFCRHCGASLNPEQVVCTKCGSPVGMVSRGAGGLTVAPQAVASLSQTLNTYFMWFWICLAAAIPTCGLGAIASTVFMYILLYQCWKLIPPDIARTTPGKAVGFCFIPFFNLYWMFVAFWGLGQDMNKTLQRQGVSFQVNENLGLILCILSLCCIIPYVGILVAIGAIVVAIFFLKQVKDAAVALIERG